MVGFTSRNRWAGAVFCLVNRHYTVDNKAQKSSSAKGPNTFLVRSS